MLAMENRVDIIVRMRVLESMPGTARKATEALTNTVAYSGLIHQRECGTSQDIDRQHAHHEIRVGPVGYILLHENRPSLNDRVRSSGPSDEELVDVFQVRVRRSKTYECHDKVQKEIHGMDAIVSNLIAPHL